MTVLLRSLADRKRSSLWWVLGIAGLVIFTIAFFPSLKGEANVDELVKDMPAGVQVVLGIEDGVSLGSARGYLHTRLFSSLLPVLLLILGIGAGATAIAGAEEDGTLELLLSNPITRSRVALERYLVLPVLLLGLTAIAAVALLVFAPLAGALEDVSGAGLAAAFVGTAALALLHASVAFAIGAWSGRRNTAIAGASALAVAGYLAHGLMSAVDLPTAVQALTPWYWFLHENMLVRGPNLESWLPALVLSAGIAGVGFAGFLRRDLR